MQYVKNNRVLMRILFVLRGCIAVELQGPARFAKLHSEIMNVARSSVNKTYSAGIRKDKKKFQHVITYNGLWSCCRIIIKDYDYFFGEM